MRHRRGRLRTPALLGILLLLVGSGIDASGIGVCRTHGHGLHDHSAEHRGTEVEASPDRSHTEGHASGHAPHHGDHDHGPPAHGHAHEHASHEHAPHGHASEVAELQAGPIHSLPEHGCECRMVCAAAAGASAPAPHTPPPCESEPPTERRALAATDEPAPFHLLPFALPFSNGPPPQV